MGEELSDVVMNTVRLADVCNIDLSKEILHKFGVNAKNYPVQECLRNSMHNKPTKKTKHDDEFKPQGQK